MTSEAIHARILFGRVAAKLAGGWEPTGEIGVLFDKCGHLYLTASYRQLGGATAPAKPTTNMMGAW